MKDNVIDTIKNEYYNDPSWVISPIKTTVYNSDGKKIETINKYLHEYNGSEVSATGEILLSSELKNELIKRNIIAIPFETQNKVDDVVVGGQRIKLGAFDANGNATTIGLGTSPLYIEKYYAYESRNSIYSNNNWNLKATINQYDMSAGKIKKITANGWSTGEIYTWDALKRLQSKNFGGLTWSFTYWDNSMFSKESIDENGLRKRYEYDDFFRLKKVADRMKPDGTDIQATTLYNYHYAGQPTTYSIDISKNFVSTNTTFSGGTAPLITKQYLDGLGRPVEVVKEGYTPTQPSASKKLCQL